MITTSAWGELELNEEQVYRFPKGLPGFEAETAFAIIPVEDTPFSYLQSIHQADLSFLIVNPFEVKPDYSFELSDEDKEELNIEEQVAVYSIVTIHQDAVRSTMNLLAPLVLNPVTREGKQIILHQSGYETKHQIWSKEAESMKGGE